MAKITGKVVGQNAALGIGVVLLTPIIAGLGSSIPGLDFSIGGLLTVGTALAAGISAFVVNLAIDRFM